MIFEHETNILLNKKKLLFLFSYSKNQDVSKIINYKTITLFLLTNSILKIDKTFFF